MNNEKLQTLTADFLYESGIDYDVDTLKCVIASDLIINKYISGKELFGEGVNDNDVHIFIEDGEELSTFYNELIKKIKKKDKQVILVFVTNIKIYKKMSSDKNAIEKNRNGKFRVLYLGSDGRDQYAVGIHSRLQKVHHHIDKVDETIIKESGIEKQGAQGYIYTASVKSIVDIYKDLGDVLFEKNVRVGINSDSRGVGDDIKDTLANNPEKFWFFNNGITVICNEEPDVSKYNELVFKKNTFSVINGAQTINACQEFFDDEKYQNQHNNAGEKARVILRVVVSKSDYFTKEVSGALNTQKPIENEDLAYNSSFVKYENEAYQRQSDSTRDQRLFKIDRRGEQTFSDYRYSLPQVYRAMVVSPGVEDSECIPWKALNTANNEVLSLTDYNLNNSIFKIPEDLEKTKDSISGFFAKKYQTVNVSMKLFAKYKALSTKLAEDYENTLRNNEDDNERTANDIKINNINVAKGRAVWYFVNEFWVNYVQLTEKDVIREDCVTWFDNTLTDEILEQMITLFWSRFEKVEDKIVGQKIRNKEFYEKLMEKEVDSVKLKMMQQIARQVVVQ